MDLKVLLFVFLLSHYRVESLWCNGLRETIFTPSHLLLARIIIIFIRQSKYNQNVQTNYVRGLPLVLIAQLNYDNRPCHGIMSDRLSNGEEVVGVELK